MLAKWMGLHFVDCDLVIQQQKGALLSQLIERHGVEGFVQIENEVNANLQVSDSVIATGGSVIYGEQAMRHLQQLGKVVYLKLSLSAVEERLRGKDIFARGVVMHGNCKTVADLYAERTPLYEKYAHITVDCTRLNLEETVHAVMDAVKK